MVAGRGPARGRGVPNYLSQIRIAPDGGTAWIPSKKDNIARGRHRDGNDLDFETQTRAVVSQIDLRANAEARGRRIDFNDRDLAQALAFTPVGDAFVVAFQGSNVIEVWGANALTRLSEVPVGRAPDGLAFGPDGRRLYVHDFLDRSVTVLNTAGLLDGAANEPIVVETVATVGRESLAPEVLRGKRIFYNAADARMSLDGYISCASCHLDGGSDGMVWDRTQFGEGLRNTIDLRGRRGAAGGFVHWTANFDEIQDFDTDGSGAADAADAFWNGVAGWLPLGTFAEPFTAVFAGNGRTVSHLFVGGGDNAGLFGLSSGVIRGVGVLSAEVTGSRCAGALAGLNGGRVEASWSTGAVTGDSCVGGLVGVNGLWAPDGGTFRPLEGSVTASWSRRRRRSSGWAASSATTTGRWRRATRRAR